jgi:hypothetical protein
MVGSGESPWIPVFRLYAYPYPIVFVNSCHSSIFTSIVFVISCLSSLCISIGFFTGYSGNI